MFVFVFSEFFTIGGVFCDYRPTARYLINAVYIYNGRPKHFCKSIYSNPSVRPPVYRPTVKKRLHVFDTDKFVILGLGLGFA